MITKKYSLSIFLTLAVLSYVIVTLNFETIKFLFLGCGLLCFFYFLYFKIDSFYYHCVLQLSINFAAYMFYANIDLAIVTLSFVLINIHYFKYEKTPKKLKFIKHSDLLTNNKFIIFTFCFYVLITQNIFLNFETIDWDVNSYLISSLDIGRGNLPYEGQWEDKQPLLYYIYYFLILLSGESLSIFKVINDIPIVFLAIFIYKISALSNPGQKINNILGPIIFISLMSVPWANAEYSEIYSLLFIASSYYLMLKQRSSKLRIFISGCFFSLSTLVNIGTSMFLICFIYMIYKSNNRMKNLIVFTLGSSLPHIAFLSIYIFSGLKDIYLTTLLKIPFGYGLSSSLNFGSLNSFLKSFLNSSIILYLILIFLFVEKFMDSIDILNKNTPSDYAKNINYLFITISLLFFFIAAKGFNHHLIFLLFFISIAVTTSSEIKGNFIKSFLILLFLLSFVFTNLPKSFNNLYNISSINESYPLKQLSLEIDKQFDSEYTILALDHTLILYYLDIPNYSYIIHPTNHFEDWITTNLITLNKIKDKNIISMIAEEPDVILCSNVSIVNGIPTRDNELKGYNCEISDFNYKYKKLDTTFYKNNRNINYYYDPYKDIGVYIKTKELRK